MALLRVSRLARRDVVDIWKKIAQDSVKHADRTYDLLFDTFAAIARTPGIGAKSVELPDARRFPVGNYNVYYKQSRGRVIISRVIHAKRDQRRAWGTEAHLA